jgi:hypothetical protein
VFCCGFGGSSSFEVSANANARHSFRPDCVTTSFLFHFFFLASILSMCLLASMNQRMAPVRAHGLLTIDEKPDIQGYTPQKEYNNKETMISPRSSK